jgi:hypothetical protein
LTVKISIPNIFILRYIIYSIKNLRYIFKFYQLNTKLIWSVGVNEIIFPLIVIPSPAT